MQVFFPNKIKAGFLAGLMGILTACSANVTQEVYPKTEPETAPKVEEVADTAINQAFVPTEVKDISKIKKMRSWLEYFYYNNIFDENINNETGEISEDAMISFAASYIMQLEHQGLRFDTDTFRLYIPQKMLEEVVMRFFDHKVKEHHSISKHGILFEQDHYVIQASAREWPTRLDIILVMETSPDVYLAVLSGNNTEAGEIDHQVRARYHWTEDHYILESYQMITDKTAFIGGNPLDVGTSEDDPGIESSSSFGNMVNPENGEKSEPSDEPEVSEKKENNDVPVSPGTGN